MMRRTHHRDAPRLLPSKDGVIVKAWRWDQQPVSLWGASCLSAAFERQDNLQVATERQGFPPPRPEQAGAPHRVCGRQAPEQLPGSRVGAALAFPTTPALSPAGTIRARRRGAASRPSMRRGRGSKRAVWVFLCGRHAGLLCRGVHVLITRARTRTEGTQSGLRRAAGFSTFYDLRA